MNILIISHFFPPHKGGVETSAYYTAKYLTKYGNNVIVLTSKTKGNKSNVHKMDNFLVYRFKSYNIPELNCLPQISSLGFMPLALFKLPEIIKRHNIQLIHAEGRLFPICFLTAILNQLIFKRPMIISAQGRLKIGITGIIENIFDKIITKYIYEKLKRIICVSNSLKNRFLKFKINKKKIIVIPNGVDTSEFTRQTHSQFLDRYLNDKKDYKRVVFVGRLDKQKGVEYLIRAIPKVIKKYKEVHFFILGNGNLEIELKNLVRELNIKLYVTFINFIPLKKMPEFYSSADIFCLPSIHEGFPLSIAEALSIGLIIVSSAVEGIPEAIIENENGFLVEPTNIKQLSDKLIKALNLNKEQVSYIRENNVKLAKSKYSWEIIVKKLLNLYKNSIQN